MDFEELRVVALHKHPDCLMACCDMINDEWPRSVTARLNSLQGSCDNLPTSLILINNNKTLLGHCKLSPIPSLSRSCFLETVVIAKAMRGKKLGTFMMKKVEEYCKDILKLDMIHLSTQGQQDFYSKLGYVVCHPISIYGNVKLKETSTNKKTKKETTASRQKATKEKTPPPPPPPPPPTSTPTTNKPEQVFMFKKLF
ncbi:PREDICTED: N-acetyltransferase 6 [Papilio polytes]|uniref:N-acetyltransferase 6 n=1 Tax=Papilio polytes TaxID=76194 RepID=UPI000675C72A|nr:PREDICTED: N-acetyltransferase 6 [Papilio polytes]